MLSESKQAQKDSEWTELGMKSKSDKLRERAEWSHQRLVRSGKGGLLFNREQSQVGGFSLPSVTTQHSDYS